MPHSVTRNGDVPHVTVHDTLDAHIDNMRANDDETDAGSDSLSGD
jgi:hypothetical protein